MIQEILYNKKYKCRSITTEDIILYFSKDKEGTYAHFEIKIGDKTYLKDIHLTQEDGIDEVDIENVNEILQQQGIQFVKVED